MAPRRSDYGDDMSGCRCDNGWLIPRNDDGYAIGCEPCKTCGRRLNERGGLPLPPEVAHLMFSAEHAKWRRQTKGK
jgi:hypothetical protein